MHVNHRNSKKVDILCISILHFSLGWPKKTIAVKWPLNTIQFNSKFLLSFVMNLVSRH